MNLHGVWVVFIKELLDVLRDRRTLIAMILVPMVLYPILAVIMLQAAQFEKGQRERETYTIAVPDEAHRTWLADVLKEEEPSDVKKDEKPKTLGAGRKRRDLFEANVKSDQFQFVVTKEPLEDFVRSGKAHVALRTEPSIPPTSGADRQSYTVQLFFDAADSRSEFASSNLTPFLTRRKNAMVLRRLEQSGLSKTDLSPLDIDRESVASAEKLGGYILGLTLPYFLVMMTVTSAIYPAMDLTVGERERGTLESLMTAPVNNTDIMAGKFLATTVVAIIASVFNLVSLVATVLFTIHQAASAPGLAVQLSLPLSMVPAVLLVLLPLAMLFSAILLATCSFAKSMKEAQLYITPVLVVALIPPIMVLSPAIELKGIITVLPVANVLVLLRELFVGKFEWTSMLLVFGSTSLYAAAAVVVAARLYGQEAVLFADTGSYRTFLMRRYYRPADYPDPAVALLLVAAIFPVMFLWQTSHATVEITIEHLLFVIVSTMIGFFVLPPVLLAWYLKADLKKTFSLRQPSAQAWLGTILISLGAPILNYILLQWIGHQFAIPKEVEEYYKKLTEAIAAAPLGLAIFSIALVPGISEEILFRGWLLAGLRRKLGPVMLCIVVGLLFGFYHVDLVRVPITGILGIILAFVVWRSGSIYPAMLIHFVNNTAAILVAKYAPSFTDLDSGENLPLWIQATGVVVLATGLAIVATSPRPGESPELPSNAV